MNGVSVLPTDRFRSAESAETIGGTEENLSSAIGGGGGGDLLRTRGGV